jgi:hypothetical protein
LPTSRWRTPSSPNPDLDAFILIGGWAQFAPQAYAQVTDQVMDKLKSKDLIIIAGDTLPPQTKAFRDGSSHAQVGQRPFEMGYKAPDVMIQLINGERWTIRSIPGLTSATRKIPASAPTTRKSPEGDGVGLQGSPLLFPHSSALVIILMPYVIHLSKQRPWRIQGLREGKPCKSQVDTSDCGRRFGGQRRNATGKAGSSPSWSMPRLISGNWRKPA